MGLELFKIFTLQGGPCVLQINLGSEYTEKARVSASNNLSPRPINPPPLPLDCDILKKVVEFVHSLLPGRKIIRGVGGESTTLRPNGVKRPAAAVGGNVDKQHYIEAASTGDKIENEDSIVSILANSHSAYKGPFAASLQTWMQTTNLKEWEVFL